MMTVNDLREALEKMPGHWSVHVAVVRVSYDPQ